MFSGHVPKVLVTTAIVAASLVWPSTADAQRHRSRRPAVRSVVYVGGLGWWGPRYVLYDPYWRQGWGPYPPYGYPRYSSRYDLLAAVRLDATPREAEVYVDGYSAGVVDDFDGVFQRLRLEPGGHDITLYLPGYRTETRSLYFRPDSYHRIRIRLEPLAAGETSEPPPAPAARRGDAADRADRRPRTDEPEPQREAVARVGTLALRVQPEDAEITIDGAPWSAAAGESRLAIRLAEGRHRIEVRKTGYTTYAEEILIQRNRVLSLNVGLSKGAG